MNPGAWPDFGVKWSNQEAEKYVRREPKRYGRDDWPKIVLYNLNKSHLGQSRDSKSFQK